MEILLGIIISFVVEGVKKLKARFGDELGKKMIYLTVFVLALVWTVLTKFQIITPSAVTEIVTIFTTAIATYELVIKNINKLFE